MKSEESSRSSIPPDLGGAISETLVGFLDYLYARLNLLQFETKEAGTDLATRAICFLVAALFFGLAYLVALIGGAAWISISQEWAWYKVSLIAAGVHLLVAVILVLVAKRRFGRAPFCDSIAEVKRDREWLQSFRVKS